MANANISLARIFGVNPALQADLGGAAIPGLLAATLHLPRMQIVRTPTQIFRQLSFGKGAKLAM
jgi:hypothetical protein